MKGNKLGDVISELRRAKNLTQKEFADRIGTTDKSVSRWETGGGYPNIDMIYQISKFFKVSFYSLLEARMADDNADDEVVDAIMNEFHNMNSRNAKRIKMIFIGALIITIILIISLLFTNSYNKFKVYQVSVENEEMYLGNGFYVETKIKDTLYLNNIVLRDADISDKDTIIVDLLYKDNDKEHIIQSFSELNNISFSNYEDNAIITDHINNIYLKITIIDDKNNVQEYITKLIFTLDFSNNKIYLKEDDENINKRNFVNPESVKELLLENGFEEVTHDILKLKKVGIVYYQSSQKLMYNYEKNNLSYRIVYNLNLNYLDVQIFNKNNLELENYEYDILNNKIIECNVGRCNSYNEILTELTKKLPYLFD